MTIRRSKKLKKEKVITLRMNKEYFDIIQEFAEVRGLSVNAYLNSVAEAQAEFFIPFNSVEMVTISKKLLSRLFESVQDDELERMAQEWGNEGGKNAALLGWGALTLESAIELHRIVAKYWARSDIKITVMNNGNVPNSTPRVVGKRVSDNRDEAEDNILDILLILRHQHQRTFLSSGPKLIFISSIYQDREKYLSTTTQRQYPLD